MNCINTISQPNTDSQKVGQPWLKQENNKKNCWLWGSSPYWHQFKRLLQAQNRSDKNLALYRRISLTSWQRSSTSIWFQLDKHTSRYHYSNLLLNSFDLIGEIWVGFYRGKESDGLLRARENTGKSMGLLIIQYELIYQVRNNLQSIPSPVNKHWINIVAALILTNERCFLFRKWWYDGFGITIFKVYFQQLEFTVTAPNCTSGTKFFCPITIFPSE